MTKEEELIFIKGVFEGISRVRESCLEYSNHHTFLRDENGDRYICGKL